MKRYVESIGGSMPTEVSRDVDQISAKGGTPLVVVDGSRVMGTIFLKDIVKGGIRERFAKLREMGIRTVMITGDNPRTAAAIAAEAGVDDFMAEATPEDKMRRIKAEQQAGHLVAMTGDGTNDAPALAQADVGVAMNTGTQAAREAGNMVDLDSDPTKLIDIIEIGKQLLMTRGSLTTFSLANDVAKYFAILPALFIGLAATSGNATDRLPRSNVMNLHSWQSAILSAVIFNALIIVALIPLALKGVAYRPMDAASLLRRNLLIYGLGGIIAPFPCIKLIDLDPRRSPPRLKFQQLLSCIHSFYHLPSSPSRSAFPGRCHAGCSGPSSHLTETAAPTRFSPPFSGNPPSPAVRGNVTFSTCSASMRSCSPSRGPS